MTSADLSRAQAKRIWLHAQGLDAVSPFGTGPQATQTAITHLGYVQIDTINVIERCHHHILWTRIPTYRRRHLHQAQTIDKSVFEYWTHALAYIPTSDLPYFIGDMQRQKKSPRSWFDSVTRADLRKVITRIRDDGALSIRDIDDDVLVDKDHAWASRKPSKRAMQLAFHTGQLTVSERVGMLKTYELTARHFQWDRPPRKATDSQVAGYLIDRALKSQGLISLDSICYLNAHQKPQVRKVIEDRLRKRRLIPVKVRDMESPELWTTPDTLAHNPKAVQRVHILSPFDPLVIQRKRLAAFFDYRHLFEAYLPKEKRAYGYFGLPVLIDDEIVAVLDIKADRERRKLLMQKWSWVGTGRPSSHKQRIEEKLHLFEKFQFAN